MKKIPTVFQRNYATNRLIRDEVVPGCEWVLAGEGWATRKFDGTACMVRDGKLYKRYDAKHGKPLPPDFDFEPSDPVTGHWTGWVPVGDGPEDQWHREALANGDYHDGTYELCGPKVQGNPEGMTFHSLIPHGVLAPSWRRGDCPRTFDAIREYLEPLDIEGIVFHHPDGRMAKVKKKDFGLRR